jgi:hypothetical protein
MFATGLGIAGQLPYIKQLIQDHKNRKIKTQRIALFWQVERENHSVWANEWIDELLEHDQGKYVRLY